jgi:hypothetical protein
MFGSLRRSSKVVCYFVGIVGYQDCILSDYVDGTGQTYKLTICLRTTVLNIV